MAALHLVSKSQHASDALLRCRRALGPNDSVLFLSDGCYNALPVLFSSLRKEFCDVNFHVLRTDAELRGLTNRIHDSLMLIDDAEFVDLTVSHQPILSWF